MTIVWIAGLILGVVIAAGSSRRAVVAALSASQVARVSPALIGVTVMAVGTDLPEIANSIASAITGHGDVNVGDSAGSAMTQVTLVLAILCFVASPVRVERRTVAVLGSLATAALVLDAALVNDGLFSRWEGLTLIAAWLFGLVVVQRMQPDPMAPVPVMVETGDHAGDQTGDRRAAVPFMFRTIGWLGVVAASSMLVVRSFVELTEALGVPELVASAVVLALGTSLPELVVDLTAIRQGAVALAIGDLFGSSLVDATLALGSGPAIRSTIVSSNAALTCVITAVGVAGATVIAARRREHGRASGVMLLGVYAGVTAALVGWTS